MPPKHPRITTPLSPNVTTSSSVDLSSSTNHMELASAVSSTSPSTKGGNSIGYSNSNSTGGGGTGGASHIPLDFGIMVATRIRPFNRKEIAEHAKEMKVEVANLTEPPVPAMDVEGDGKSIVLLDVKDMSSKAVFNFDYVFSPFAPTVEIASPASAKNDKNKRNSNNGKTGSAFDGGSNSDDDDEESEEVLAERSQAEVYKALGQPIVRSAWDGYNCCIFAYGQTSSGKTYTMMGTKRDPGIIPRLCKELFEKIEADEDRQQRGLGPVVATPLEGAGGGKPPAGPQQQLSRRLVKVTVSYMEIYNEQVRDLLKPPVKGAKPKFNAGGGSGDPADEYQSLKVRQHPLHGPFVEGLTTVNVDNWLECVRYIRQGNEVRSHCTTAMNESSSRSHAIFQMVLTQTEALGARVRGKDVTNHKVSKINLVDLAGSERILRTNVTGKHLTEAQNINQSLSTLRRVIDTLVQKKKNSAATAHIVVPYRESMLTWILSDNFGGNSKTVMCANVSPHHSNFGETESTLRYATLARGVVNRIRVNEDPSAKLIRELQTQLKALTEEMKQGPQQNRVEELLEEINENKRAMDELGVKEEGMKRLITESRAREEKLLNDVQSHQLGEEKWRKEAEKLRREKEELRRALADIAKSNPDVFSQTKEKNFWNIDLEDPSAISANDVVNDDSMVCPPLSRRKSSMRIKRQSIATKPSGVFTKENEKTPTGGAGGANTLWDLASSSGKTPRRASDSSATGGGAMKSTTTTSTTTATTKSSRNAPVQDVPTRTDESITMTEIPRFGRRAGTEEGASRPRESTESAGSNGGRPMSEQYFQQMNSRLAAGQMGGNRQTSSVPLSLQHLAGLVPVSASSNAPNVFAGSFNSQSPGVRSPGLATPPLSTPSSQHGTGTVRTPTTATKAPPSQNNTATSAPASTSTSQQRDALDSFLEGGDDTANTKPARGVPPWRKNKK